MKHKKDLKVFVNGVQLTPIEIELGIEAAIKNAENFGAPRDMFVPEYGWIMRDGKVTPEGIEFYKELEKISK